MSDGSAFNDLGELVRLTAESVLVPPERLTVSDAAAKYRYLDNEGSYVGPWLNEETPYLVEPMNVLTSREYESCIFLGPAQGGKALCLDTPIATPHGWTRMGDLRVGSEVFDERGEPCRVTFVTETMLDRQCYNVWFDDGQVIRADAEHLWEVDDTDMHVKRVLTTEQLLERLTIGKEKPRSRWAIPVAKPIETPEKELPIPPYVLGYWLGDGWSYGARVCGTPEDLQHAKRQFETEGVECREFVDEKNLCWIDLGEKRTKNGRSGGSTGMNSPLRELELLRSFDGEKHIPFDYLWSSVEQRFALLQGIMDSDGTCADNGTCEVSLSSQRLADGLADLLSSLGVKFQRAARLPEIGNVAHRFTFTAYADTPVFRLPRKVAKQRSREDGRPGYTQRRFIEAILPVDSVPVRCITVDSPSHLYLAGRGMVPTHNTEIILNWIGYTARCDPADFFLIQTARDTARDFSYRRIDKMHRDSKELGAMLRPGSDNDNIFDKFYRNGMMLTLGWPTINQLSGKPVPRVALTDYDRMPQDVEKNGPPFPLARKRTTTFGSFGMTLAESSPSFDVKDPKWKLPHPDSHMFPPTDGIGGLYNEGDRRCFYWQCPHCGEWFEPKFSLLKWDFKNPDPFEAAMATIMACPRNGCVIEPKHKYEMNRRGVWLREGQKIDRDGNKLGVGVRSRSASFWLKGPAARFITWQTLVERYLLAQQTFERTGESKALKATINTDQGEAFWPLNVNDSNRLPEDIQAKAIQWADKKVPYGARFLLATVDVQKSRFVVQVFGVGPSDNGVNFDLYLVDRFDIQKSKRKDDAGDTLWVKPYAVQEDWELITEQVVDREYELEDGSGFMSIKMVGIDSGGKSGSTTRAYNYWRQMRDNGNGGRVLLIKGEPKLGAPRAEIDFPDSDRKDRSAGARGEIPVLFLNSNVLKDMLLGMVDYDEKTTLGGRHFTNKWTPEVVYAELTVEFRDDRGRWQNPAKRRNEAWDLGYYCLGLCVILKVEGFDWDSPESWFAEWSSNSLVRSAEQEKRFASSPTTDYGFAKFGKSLG